MFRHLKRVLPAAFATVAFCSLASGAHANNYGESLAWQFQTGVDRVNAAFLLDLIEKRRGGYYAASNYSTTIERQVNCSIAPSAMGNSSGQYATANSPSVTGATSTASGNGSATDIAGRGAASAQTTQTNSGYVQASLNGSTSAQGYGRADQALNSAQHNSGNQSASVSGSSACAFGALN